MNVGVIRTIGEFGLLTRLVTNPTVDREILLLSWNLRAHVVAYFFNGDRAALLGGRRSCLSLFNQLRWLLMLVHVDDVR